MTFTKTTTVLTITAAICSCIWLLAYITTPNQQAPLPVASESPTLKEPKTHQHKQNHQNQAERHTENNKQTIPNDSPATEDNPPPLAPIPQVEDAIDGEYLFKFYNEHDRKAFEEYARKHGIRIIDSMSVGNIVRVGISDRAVLDELLRKGPIAIEWMPNSYVRVPERADNVPLTPASGGYQPFGDRALEWLGVKDNSTWGQGILVAVLDSGISASGSLSGRSISQIDLIGESSYAAIHGTAVASIIAGTDSGVAPAVDLLSIKVMSDSGTGDAFTLAKGIIEAVDRGANIINMSLGSNSDSFVVREAIQYAVERNVLLVAAAGNDALEGVLYPARYDDVIAVAGVDFNSEHLYFSNRGDEVDIAAPAAGIAVVISSDQTTGFSGTSVASPFVAGAAAEIWSSNTSLTPDEIRQIITDFSNDAGAPGDDDFYGSGVLDVDRINSRDDTGNYDMAAMAPYVQSNDSGGTVDISAQNRGTEIIAEVTLDLDFMGRKDSLSFYNVYPGNTISHQLSFPLPPDEGIELRFVTRPIGVTDSTPNNNAIYSIISQQ